MRTMLNQINYENYHWPALYRLALALERPIDMPADGITGPFAHAKKCVTASYLLRQFIKEHPIRGWIKLWLALEEYWECIYYLNSIIRQAKLIRNQQNSQLVEAILQHGYRDLALGERKAWCELASLANQKLLHLAYYETIADYQADLRIS